MNVNRAQRARRESRRQRAGRESAETRAVVAGGKPQCITSITARDTHAFGERSGKTRARQCHGMNVRRGDCNIVTVSFHGVADCYRRRAVFLVLDFNDNRLRQNMQAVRRIRLQKQRHPAVCDCSRRVVVVLIGAAKRARQTHRAEVVCEPPRKCHRLPRRRDCRRVFRVQRERAPVGEVDCEHRRAVYHFVFGIAGDNRHRVVPRRRQPANLRRQRARKAARVVRADIAESDRAPVCRRQNFNFHIAHGAKVLAGDKQRARIVAAAAAFNAARYQAEIRQAVSPHRANARRQRHRRSQRRSIIGDDGYRGNADGNKCQRAVPAHGNKC